jgi:hypothetical protein
VQCFRHERKRTRSLRGNVAVLDAHDLAIDAHQLSPGLASLFDYPGESCARFRFENRGAEADGDGC